MAPHRKARGDSSFIDGTRGGQRLGCFAAAGDSPGWLRRVGAISDMKVYWNPYAWVPPEPHVVSKARRT